jgi:hypothetical protein
LEQWRKNGWLIEFAPDPADIQGLLAVAQRDLKDCRAKGLSEDGQFNIAYNAALQLSRAALHVAGFEIPKGDSHHFRAIDALVFTLGIEARIVDKFQVFRKKRAAGIYEMAGLITKTDADEMIALAGDLQSRVLAHLKSKYPQFLKSGK